MIIGQIDEMKIVQIAAECAPLNTSRPIGSHASGDTGRSRLMIGSVMPARNRKRPIMKPSGMPTSAARPKPMPTRPSEFADLPADALVVRAVAVERVGEHRLRGVEGRAGPGIDPPFAISAHRPTNSDDAEHRREDLQQELRATAAAPRPARDARSPPARALRAPAAATLAVAAYGSG